MQAWFGPRLINVQEVAALADHVPHGLHKPDRRAVNTICSIPNLRLSAVRATGHPTSTAMNPQRKEPFTDIALSTDKTNL